MLVTKGLAHTGFRFLIDDAFAEEVRQLSVLSNSYILTPINRSKKSSRIVTKIYHRVRL